MKRLKMRKFFNILALLLFLCGGVWTGIIILLTLLPLSSPAHGLTNHQVLMLIGPMILGIGIKQFNS